MKSVEEFLVHYHRQRRWTRNLVGAIPEEHFDWRPSPTSFSCGDLVRHLMQAEIFWSRLLVKSAASEAFDPFGLEGDAEQRMQIFRRPNLESAANPAYGTSFGEALARWSDIERRTDENLRQIPDRALHAVEAQHPLTLVRAPLWELMLLMIEHEAHHRGQLSAYLKMLGVPQPAAAIGS
jgi:uncharacterized damage-inducible protein DinB